MGEFFEGSLTLEEGDVMKGRWKHGKLFGEATTADGLNLEFMDGELKRIEYPNGDVYDGETKDGIDN